MPEPTAAPNTTEPETGKRAAATTYIVLRFNADTDEWMEHGDRVNATSAHAAIRSFITSRPGEGAGAYVAVPQRSWKPVTVQAVQTTVLKLEDAT